MPKPRYVVICPQGLGDSLEATPMLAALRTARSDAYIEVVVMRRAAVALFEGLPHLVDRVRYLPFWEKGNLAFALAALRMLFLKPVDASFLTYPSARRQYAILHGLVRSKARYTHRYPEADRANALIPHVHVVEIQPKHNVLRNFDLLSVANIETAIPDAYTIPDAWRAEGDREDRTIVMHVGSIAHDNLDERRWPQAMFADLARRMIARGFSVGLLCGPEEREETFRVRDGAPGANIIEGSLENAARTLSRATAVVANDNGIAHLAAGVGTPVISLFGPTPLFHAPYGPSSLPLRPSDCPPCFSPLRSGLSCVLGIDYRCMKFDLTVELVEASLLSLVADRARPV